MVGAVITDVTELKEVEEKLREEAVFRERFIGVLAHDLRDPLAAVAMAAGSLLRRGDTPATWVRSVGHIAHAAERMGRMIGNLLDFTRCREGGGIGVRRKPIDLADVVREVVSELEASRPGREIAVSVTGDTHAELDPDRMAQVVSNLTGNALTYSPAESVVRVEVEGREGELVLAVHNAGAPIPPGVQKMIFMPFQRGVAPGGGSPAMRGLGLGEQNRRRGRGADVRARRHRPLLLGAAGDAERRCLQGRDPDVQPRWHGLWPLRRRGGAVPGNLRRRDARRGLRRPPRLPVRRRHAGRQSSG